MRRLVAATLAGAACLLTACASSTVSGTGTGTGGGSASSAPSGVTSAGSPASSSGPASGTATAPSLPPTTATPDPQNRWALPELPAAARIPGILYRPEPDHTHVTTVVTYDVTPPIGGDHSAFWADCSGTTYPAAIANENAVHMLEHGAVWITYRPGLPVAEVNALSQLIANHDHLALSPYPGLSSPISLQAWNYQLRVDSASDPRIVQFINTLRSNPSTAPEVGASCANPDFVQHPSTFGHPTFGP